MTVTSSKAPVDVFGAKLTRRQFVKTGGMLAVGISIVGAPRLSGETPNTATHSVLNKCKGAYWAPPRQGRKELCRLALRLTGTN
jgi:hypothetical protein